MKKGKWLSSLLAVVMTATMLPTVAFAQDGARTTERTTGLDLSGKTEAETNEQEGWTWTPDGAGGYTLVLENVNISDQSGDAVKLPRNVDVEIILKGTNRIQGSAALSGVETKGGLVTIKGAEEGASLTAISNEGSDWGTISVSNLLIESGNVYTEGDGNVIDNFSMTGGSLTINQTFGADGWAALHTTRRASITGGKLEITTDDSAGYGIYNYPSGTGEKSGVYIGGNAEVVINKSNIGIVVVEKSSGNGKEDGKIEIAGGTVKVNSSNIGLYTAVEDIILSGGNIEVTSDDIALKAAQGNIDFTGSDTGINAPTPTWVSESGKVTGSYHDIHQWASEWTYDEEGHWKACTNPGCEAKNEYASHQGGTSTCTEQKICTVCNQKYGSLGGHAMEYYAAAAASCTQPGNVEYWHCQVCGKNFADGQGEKELNATDIPALGHKVKKTEAKEPTGTVAGNIAYWYCERCGKYFRDEALTQEITKEQTVLAVTGMTAKPVKGTAYSPKTGDNNSLAFGIMMFLLAAGGFTGAVIYSRNRKASI